VGIFCGSFHHDKKIEFLLDSAIRIHQKNPRFILLIGGAGQQLALVERYIRQHDFIVYLGPLHGRHKALAFNRADVFLNPGMVGLAILDAFTASLPVFTTKQAEHSPEIDYLQGGYNGMMSDMSEHEFADMVSSAFASDTLISTLRHNALASSEQFSIENMANHFLAGIQAFVSHPYR
jgi:glycosyltransferase involved in cell wall biosynthesis